MYRIQMRLSVAVLLIVLPVTIAAGADDEEFSSKYKSTGTARMLTLAGTFIPIGIGIALRSSQSEATSDLGTFFIASGACFGPGVGHAYADRPVRFGTGALLRAGCLAVSAFSVVIKASDVKDSSRGSGIGFVVGPGGYLASSLYDFATVDASVDKYNRAHTSPLLGIGPSYSPDDGGIGMVITIRF